MTQFEQIYRDNFDCVYAYIFRLSGDKHIAEEITSETFFKALKAIDSFRGDCEIRVWLCQIAKNCYYSYSGKKQKLTSLDEQTQLTDESSNPEEEIINKDDAARIRNALHHIPEPYKEVFMWRVFAEMSFRQIGQMFKKSENWACVTYHRARKMILERMEENDNE